jgi:hypothetical protein
VCLHKRYLHVEAGLPTRLQRQSSSRSEQDRDVENEPAVVVDDRTTVDDTSPIAARHDDELGLEIHRHRTDPALPPAREISAAIVRTLIAARYRAIVGAIVVANDDHVVGSPIAAVTRLIHDDATAVLPMVPPDAGFRITRQHRSAEKRASDHHSY